jgi:hypothetical protein
MQIDIESSKNRNRFNQYRFDYIVAGVFLFEFFQMGDFRIGKFSRADKNEEQDCS